jgi:hypothetical protein
MRQTEVVRQPAKNEQKHFTGTSFSISTPEKTRCWKTQEKTLKNQILLDLKNRP